jgi:drug/metabolite transporter (DMT)-like permease
VTAVLIALVSAALWGAADFFGGIMSRRFAVPMVLGGMYVTSLSTVALFVAITGSAPPPAHALIAATLAGLAGISGLLAFYRALAIGTMSIVAPVASTGVALPVLVGLLSGDDPGFVRAIGLGAAVVGVVLASREHDDATTDAVLERRSVLLALASGVGFGSYFVGASIAAHDSVPWALLMSRIAATPIVVTLALRALRARAPRPGRRQLAAFAGMGLLDLAANALYNHATTIGQLSTVSVAGSMYPVMTVALAALVLGERVRGVQRAGVAIALIGVALIASG